MDGFRSFLNRHPRHPGPISEKGAGGRKSEFLQNLSNRSSNPSLAHATIPGWTAFLMATILCGCTLHQNRNASVSGAKANNIRQQARIAVRRSLEWLFDHQYGEADEKRWRVYAGDWPQFADVQGKLIHLRWRDANPFTATFIHHALSHATPPNADALGLSLSDLDRASRMRKASVAMMRRFAAPENSPAAGSFGFWPEPSRQRHTLERSIASRILRSNENTRSYGALAPNFLPWLPEEFWIWRDADDTSLVSVALLESARLDSGVPPDRRFLSIMADRRDSVDIPRGFPDWLPAGSGAFLTWFPERKLPGWQDNVDPAVNANILFAVGAHDALRETPGVRSAARVLTRTVQERRHHRMEEISTYYGDTFFFHYLVSRAFHEGGVRELRSAVEILADEIEIDARRLPGGEIFWDRGHPQLNTAFAVLTLLNAGRRGDLTHGGVRYLAREQCPRRGCWKEGPIIPVYLDRRVDISWRSRAFVTGIAMEALCRWLVEEPPAGSSGNHVSANSSDQVSWLEN